MTLTAGNVLGRSTEPNEHVGSSVALSGDAKRLVIGAPNDVGTTNSQIFGAAYIFKRGDSPGAWGSTAGDGSVAVEKEFSVYTFPNRISQGHKFGSSVALDQDGNTLVIASSGGNRVNVFERSGTTWTHKKTITSSGGVISLDDAGDRLAIGSPGDDTGGG